MLNNASSLIDHKGIDMGVNMQGELQQEVLEHVSVEGHRALAHFRKGHPLIPGMTLKVRSHPRTFIALPLVSSGLEVADLACMVVMGGSMQKASSTT